MDNRLNIYQEAIETLLLEGYNILHIIQPDGQSLYFNVYEFQESYFNTAQSVDFNTVQGINITNFLSTHAVMSRNSQEFLRQFAEECDKLSIVRLKFSKDTKWYYWEHPFA